jgi:hypothetical protein
MVARGASLRPVTQGEIDTFWRDGFVCLRQVIAPEWIGRMQLAVDRWLGSPECIDYTEFGASVAQQAGAEVMLDAGERRGRFFSGLDHWKSDIDFADFAQRRDREDRLPSGHVVLSRRRSSGLHDLGAA